MTESSPSLLRPSDFAITLICVQPHVRDGWLYSDEVRHRLKWLGFDVSSQLVVARLKAMCKEDAPRFERRDSGFDVGQYRVTRWGCNEISNKLPGVRYV